MGIDAKKRARPSRNNTLGTRKLRLGYYFIVTDAKETEKNYLNGFKRSLPAEAKDNIEIHVESADTETMLNTCLEKTSLQSQNRIPWLVFDRDRVTDFDDIIKNAEKHGVRVAWSNPCIEVWLGAYFGKVISKTESVQCVSEFGHIYKSKIGHEYKKSDSRIYEKISRAGNEEVAINLVASRHISAQVDCRAASDMCPCSTMYQLIKEIRDKVPS
jgi:RloB-like protein